MKKRTVPLLKQVQSPLYFFYRLLMLSAFLPAKLKAQGDVLIFPKRVVFEGAKRSEEIFLVNKGKDTATYAISFTQIRMNKDGDAQFITMPDSGQRFADKNLRFFPRTVTLAPSESQLVKVQVTKLTNLTNGEYRSHLYFRSVPRLKPLEQIRRTDSSNTGKTTMNLRAIYGLSIPIIIRMGSNNTKVSISDPSLEMLHDSVPILHMIFNRTGDMSVYGNVVVDYIPPQGKSVRVGIINGVATYTPNSFRQFKAFLNKEKRVNYHIGKLHISYVTNNDTDKLVTLASTDIILH